MCRPISSGPTSCFLGDSILNTFVPRLVVLFLCMEQGHAAEKSQGAATENYAGKLSVPF